MNEPIIRALIEAATPILDNSKTPLPELAAAVAEAESYLRKISNDCEHDTVIDYRSKRHCFDCSKLLTP